MPGSEQILAGMESNSPSEDESAPLDGGSPSPGGSEEGVVGMRGLGMALGSRGSCKTPRRLRMCGTGPVSHTPSPTARTSESLMSSPLPCLLCHPR